MASGGGVAIDGGWGATDGNNGDTQDSAARRLIFYSGPGNATSKVVTCPFTLQGLAREPGARQGSLVTRNTVHTSRPMTTPPGTT